MQRSVLRAAVDLVVKDQACWQEMGRYYIPTTHLDGLTVEPTRIAKMKTAGFLSVLHILAGLGGPHPISPFLLLLAIVGRERACVLDAALWRLLDAELLQRFTAWAEYDGVTPVPVNNPHIFGLLTAASYDVSSPCSDCTSHTVLTSILRQPRTLAGIMPSAQTLKNMEMSMVSAAVFGAPNVSAFVDFEAFRAGMSVASLPRRSLEQVRCLLNSVARDH